MKWLKQNWIKVGLGILISGALFFANGWSGWDKSTDTIALRCPDSYNNPDEKIADLKKFSDSYYAKHPNASEVDLSDEMVSQWKANNCTEALKRYNDYLAGNVSAETKQTIGDIVDEYANSSYYENSELGFSFQYPSDLVVEVDKDISERLFIYPKSLKTNNEPMTAIVISEATDSPEMTAEQWLNGPNSGYKASRDGQYKHITVGGQDAVITPDDWTIVKSPDGQKRISIAYFVEQDKGAVPLKKELQTILDTFTFK